jgi:hypothetical protein
MELDVASPEEIVYLQDLIFKHCNVANAQLI